MNILYLRSWSILPYSGTFSILQSFGLGATESQMLAYLKIMKSLGNEITVYGITDKKIIEEGILFSDKNGKEEILKDIRDNQNFDAIFFNVVDGLDQLRNIYPSATFIEICQNGPHFENDKFIDIYALVSQPQFAYYAVNYRKYRNKTFLLPNVPPHKSIYSKIKDIEKENQIIWVGSVNKQGFYRWATAMKTILTEFEFLKWKICVPSYELESNSLDYIIKKYNLPSERTYLTNLNTYDLGLEIKKSKILLASLGGEDAGVSYLDGHSLGVPVLSGDDIYGKYHNLEGTGLRCTTIDECKKAIRLLLDNDNLASEMGELGKEWIELNLNETHREYYLKLLLKNISLRNTYKIPVKSKVQSDKKFSLVYYLERIKIKFK